MVFSSLLFLFRFFPVVLLLYFVPPALFRMVLKRPGGAVGESDDYLPYRNVVLFLTSLVFYAWGEPVYVLLMLFSIAQNYAAGLAIAHFRHAGKKGAAKGTLIISLVLGIACLGYFKYADFAVTNINLLLGKIAPGFQIPLPAVTLPIGISFYTFQTMSYTIDVYRGTVRAQKNPITFGTYVAMFPQLIAGPIVQYKTVEKELHCRKTTAEGFSSGSLRFVAGLGKKVLLANSIGLLWDSAKGALTLGSNTQPSVLLLWLGALAYTFQIYFDFSGYSDMAIGMGRMFGFHFLENFDHPYLSASVTEFWRRWHISLGAWFRDYVYIPLGGNRKGAAKQFRNILIVWALTGIWHGASWNFLIWGLYFGFLLILEKLFLKKALSRLPRVVGVVYTFLLAVISWVIFACDDLGTCLAYLRGMFGLAGLPAVNDYGIFSLTGYAALLLVLFVAASDLPARIYRNLVRHRAGRVLTLIAMAGILLFATAFLVSDTYNPFLYFRF
ncbi:MAG: MBOAT family O-acyltransferase [Lachnospiraceae bacterium]